jgi:hypothetical protein
MPAGSIALDDANPPCDPGRTLPGVSIDRLPRSSQRIDHLSTWVLPVALLAWTAISWGGRIGLLTDAEGAQVTTWLRVGGSLLVGLATAWSTWRRPAGHRIVAGVFVGWTVLLWARALVVNWIDPPSLAFALVHTALAAVWFLLAWWVWRTRDEDPDDPTPTPATR